MKGFLAILATASVVSAHATWQELWVGTQDKVSTCARLPQSNSPVQDVTSNAMRCNANPSAASSTCSVAAGDSLTVEMHQQPNDRSCTNEAIGGNHFGPVMIYMSKVADATKNVGDGDWFKVAQDTYNGTEASWGTEILNANCGKRAFTGKHSQAPPPFFPFCCSPPLFSLLKEATEDKGKRK
ncbi:Glycoside hydrolase family 61 [Macrophomina phaseolina MS6]|uniref:AA9 family lytic polysaccharide monooxygenase n=1 Tax=Macrophomina phaseolina (strain MS6) TaxID=1126212 RepID=K2RGH7_MACPH|nr:Glycoside hydrolase family 61 [Macrophomina phaseolina MS6]